MGRHKRAGFLGNGTYDFLKQQAQITLPALGTLYFALAQIWGLPAAEQVIGTIVALDAFLGLILGYSNAKYKASDEAYDGHVVVQDGDEEGMAAVGFKFTSDASTLQGKQEARFRVVRE